MFSRHILPQAKQVRDCVQSGGDPKDLNLGGDVKETPSKGGKKGQTLLFQHLHFLTFRFWLCFCFCFLLYPFCFLLSAFFSSSFMSIQFLGTFIDRGLEIAACFGSDATVAALKWQVADPIKKDIQAIREARANGVDVKTITLPTLGGKGQTLHPSTLQHIAFILTSVFFWHLLIFSQRLLLGLEAMPPQVVSDSSSPPQSRRTLMLSVTVELEVLTARTSLCQVLVRKVHLHFSIQHSAFLFSLYGGLSDVPFRDGSYDGQRRYPSWPQIPVHRPHQTHWQEIARDEIRGPRSQRYRS